MNSTIDSRETTVAGVNGAIRPSSGNWFWSVDWDVVHQSIRPLFEDLIGRVQAKSPSIRGTVRKSSGAGVPFVYSYCSFQETSDHAIDSVVAGITFTPSGNEIKMNADIGGETSGEDWFECPEQVVPNSLPEMIDAAKDLAKILSSQTDVIHEALQQPTPQEG